MDKAKAARIGKELAILLWRLTKVVVIWSLRAAVFLFVGWFKLLIFVAMGGMNSDSPRKDEEEYWQHINRGDPMHLYDKDKH